MDKSFEVSCTIFNDRSHSSYDCNLSDVKIVVQAFLPQQAQSIVESMYNGCAKIWNVRQIN